MFYCFFLFLFLLIQFLHYADPLIDAHAVGANLIFTSMLKKSLELKEHTVSTSFDIYHDNSIAEVQKLIPLLRDFSSRVSELLAEFPEHPALLQVMKLFLFICLVSFPCFLSSNCPSSLFSMARSYFNCRILASNIT